MKALLLAAGLFVAFSSSLFAQQPASTEAPLTNADVVKLASLHLGDDVVVAKVYQAPAVNFDVSGEALARLQKGGISNEIITAMIKRSMMDAQHVSPATALAAQPPRPAPTRPQNPFAAHAEVQLHTKDGDIELAGRQGQFDQRGFALLQMVFLQYPGAESKFRTSERKPYLLVNADNDPNDKQESGYAFLVKLDPSTRKDERSLKIGKAFAFETTTTKISNPDNDWTVPYDSSQESPGVWRVTPHADLAPGEYGLYLHGLLYDFGIDK
jgi:hypothetical protein